MEGQWSPNGITQHWPDTFTINPAPSDTKTINIINYFFCVKIEEKDFGNKNRENLFKINFFLKRRLLASVIVNSYYCCCHMTIAAIAAATGMSKLYIGKSCRTAELG